MTKFSVVAILVALAVAVQGFPVLENDIGAAAAAGNWDEVHRIISKISNISFDSRSSKDLESSVRNLKPEKGGRVFAEFQAAVHSSSTDAKGQTKEQSSGYKVVNDNGMVREIIFKPHF